MRTPATSGLLAAALVGALTLTACGDATVDNDAATPSSVAPLERAPQKSTPASESAPASTSTATSERPRQSEPQPQDQGAREVDEVPDSTVPRTAEDVAYLGELTDARIDVEGVEDQLIGTASTICGGGDSDLNRATLPAVAGQLIEQGRTDKSVEEVSGIIEAAANHAYC